MGDIPVEVTRAAVLAGYVILVAFGIVTDVTARRRPDGIAPLDSMLERVMVSRTTRLGMIAAWWWFGWHFLFAPTVQVQL